MTRMTLREASRLITSRLPATTNGTGGDQIDAAKLQGVTPPGKGETVTLDPTPVLEAQITALRAVSELLREQLTDTREECDRWRQRAERLALPPPAPVPQPLPRRRPHWWQLAW